MMPYRRDGLSPYAEVALPNIITRQPYDISVHLVVPATEPNFSLGNFMTTLTLATSSNRTLAHVRKPVRVILLHVSQRVLIAPHIGYHSAPVVRALVLIVQLARHCRFEYTPVFIIRL